MFRTIRAGLLGLLIWGALFSTFASDAQAQWQWGRRGGASRGATDVDPRLLMAAERYSGDRFQFATQTPRGVRVYAVNQPRAEVLNAIDSGLAQLFDVARRHGYRRMLDYSGYTVFIGRADRTRDSAGAYSPDIALGAAQYAGSVYDKGGYVYAAGMVLSMEPGAFLIAEHERDFGRISNVARYEGEHIVLYHNDRSLYARTADHSRGGGHPILQ